MWSENPIGENEDAPSEIWQAKEESGHTPPPISPTPAELESPPSTSRCNKSCQKKKHWLDYVTFGLELLGLVVLCIYAAYTIKIYFANKKAAEAAEKAANAARDSLTVVQRAYVSIGEISGSRLGVSNNPNTIYLAVTFPWENAGYTPTRNMTTHISWYFYKHGLPKGWSFPDLWKVGQPHIPMGGVVSPRGKIGYTVGPITADDIRKIQLHKDRLFFWGWAKYRDVFDDTPEHVTQFCYELVGFNGNPFSPNLTEQFTPLWNNCDSNNCQDRECKR